MIGSSHSRFNRKLAWFGLVLGITAIVSQYITFQPLFRQMGLGPVGAAFGMLMLLTILTNLAMVAAYWSSLAHLPRKLAVFFSHAGVRTAIAAQITMVAIVYVTAIRGQLVLTLPMLITDAMLHYIAPVVYLGWWWLLPGKQGLKYSAIPRWMAWPVVYLALIMAAGLSSGAFIYPILDVYKFGTLLVARNIVATLALLAALCAILVFVAKAQSTKPNSPTG